MAAQEFWCVVRQDMAGGAAWIDCTECSPERNEGRTERARASQKTEGYLQVT